MRNPNVVLDNLAKMSSKKDYQFERLYRNLYNEEFYLLAYSNIYHKEGNLTQGTDGNTIDGFSIDIVRRLIESLKNQSYQPNPVRRTYISKKHGGKRPLGIPSFADKIVQEVLRLILESIYESNFSNHSHGFRPKRSCHTALLEIQRNFTGAKWFIEGDIKGFFDNIDHHTLINFLRKRISDEKFLNLIWKFLRAGYLEDWKFHQTYSGTPQGGIISPILSNIYLDSFDKFMNAYKKQFDKGSKRPNNPEYELIRREISKRRRWLSTGRHTVILDGKRKTLELTEDSREEIIKQLNDLEQQQVQISYTDPMYPDYKRLQYVRYADDFLIGVIGSKQDAEKVKQDIKKYLHNELKIELSLEKTLITHSTKSAKFLGHEIKVFKTNNTRSDKKGTKKRYNNGKVGLYVPFENWRDKLLSIGSLKIKQIDNREIWEPVHRTYLKDNDDLEILNIYNAEIRGFYNYYKLAHNVSVLNKFKYVMEYSMYKTFANKYKSKISSITKKYNSNGHFAISYQTKKGQRTAFFFKDSMTRQNKPDLNSKIDYLPQLEKYKLSRTKLIDRLKAEICEWCGDSNVPIEIHHVRKLKDLKGKKKWEQFMIARRRKTMALCRQCHVDLHAGRLD
ncbi:reverse transcriptase/maturase family protein [Niallia endozanthoxylica]|uniref:Group II intron reverse transcriptase/maturase n=1 Tax=Niallia endozanthoxylica TaxID=2036016 RepID=A0A5J5GTU1_9BACI|nr:reverse transcriptase/maturase family protein [Niallia endozanthoxylica]KAA9011043.1 group II intron reverse transcriptase/maturase [Niallia endozanthoxylica]